jgi:cytochrome oxidase assembly protein ShyY1
VRGIFARYTSNCLRDKRPLVDYFMASGGMKKREINVFGVLLILYNSTYAILLLTWQVERREAIKSNSRKRLSKLYESSPVKFHSQKQIGLPTSMHKIK